MGLHTPTLKWRSTVEKASTEQVASTTISSGAAYNSPATGQRDLLKRYHQWVYTCSTKNANAVAQATLRLYAVTNNGDSKIRAIHRRLNIKELTYLKSVGSRKAEDIVEITSHPLLDLLRNISDDSDEYETMELTELHLELAGNAYWYIGYDTRLGIPSSIQVLRPDLVKRVVDSKTGRLKGYLYGSGQNKIALMPEEVVHYRFPDPMNPGGTGMSPLQAVIASDEQYQRTLEYETALAQNNAIPSIGIMYDGVVNGDEVKKVEADWNRALRGTSKTGRVKVFDSRFEIKQFALTPAELNFLEGRKWTREEIAGAYGVPLSLLTTGDVNLANALVGERSYARWTLLPRLRRLEDKLNAVLRRWYGEDRIFVAFDNPIPEDDKFELERTQKLSGGAIITRDEARIMQGFTPVGGEDGSSYIPTKTAADVETSPDVKSFGQKIRMSEHEFVLRRRDNFLSFRRVNDDFGRGIDVIYGITADERVHIFAVLFDAVIWTYAAANVWLGEHDYRPIESNRAQDPLAKEVQNED